jgi:hypothetical protein
MKTIVLSFCVILAACGGSTDGGITNPPPPPPAKPDPYITIRLRNEMDTTSHAGRAHWAFYGLITGSSNPAQNGITYQGAISIQDIRLNHSQLCPAFDADSVGQRFVELIGFADTTTDNLTPQVSFDARAAAWFGGNHALPTGWDALTTTATDAWNSAQYNAGHGLTKSDPIKWGFDLTGTGQSAFYERTDSGTECSHI